MCDHIIVHIHEDGERLAKNKRQPDNDVSPIPTTQYNIAKHTDGHLRKEQSVKEKTINTATLKNFASFFVLLFFCGFHSLDESTKVNLLLSFYQSPVHAYSPLGNLSY